MTGRILDDESFLFAAEAGQEGPDTIDDLLGGKESDNGTSFLLEVGMLFPDNGKGVSRRIDGIEVISKGPSRIPIKSPERHTPQ